MIAPRASWATLANFAVALLSAAFFTGAAFAVPDLSGQTWWLRAMPFVGMSVAFGYLVRMSADILGSP